MKNKFYLLSLVVLLTISCQAFNRTWQGGSTQDLLWTSTSPSTVIIAASPTASFTPQPTTTPTPSPNPSPSATPTQVITPSPQQLMVFNELSSVISNEYLYPDFNGQDWNALRDEYRVRIENGMTDDDFYLAMSEMITRLGDDHSYFLSPQEVQQERAKFAGKQDFVGIGIIMSAIPERDRAVIIVTFPGGPAAEAGLLPRDNILAVDGEPILDENGFLRDVVRGPEGSSVTLTIQTPGQAPREVTLTRRHITGAVPVPYQVFEAPNGKRIGYMLVPTLNDSTIGDQVKQALLEMSQEARLDGLILDNRQNLGGADSVLINLLSYFTDGRLGYFISRNGRRPLEVEGEDVSGSQMLPLVVLVGPETASFGEVLSGVLQDNQRAYLIGETTGGNVETLSGYDFSDGSRTWIAHESFQPINHPEANWEMSGIVPNRVVPVNWDEVSLQDDPAVRAAIDYLQNMNP